MNWATPWTNARQNQNEHGPGDDADSNRLGNGGYNHRQRPFGSVWEMSDKAVDGI